MKKSAYIILSAIIIILGLVLLLNNQRRDEGDDGLPQRPPVTAESETAPATVYYLDASGLFLLPVTYELPAGEAAAQAALEKLLAGPAEAGMLPALPRECKLQSLLKVGDIVFVDITAELLTLDNEALERAVRAIRATVLPLMDANRLGLLMNGATSYRVFDDAGSSMDDLFGLPDINPVDAGASDGEALTVWLPDAAYCWQLPFTLRLEAELEPEQRVRRALAVLNDPPAGTGSYQQPFPALVDIDLSGDEAICQLAAAPEQQAAGAALRQECLLATIAAATGKDRVTLVFPGGELAREYSR